MISLLGIIVKQQCFRIYFILFLNICRYRAIYNYKPMHSDELELSEGDIIEVMEKCDDGWFVGTSNRSGKFGTFPGNYVERI